MTTQKRAPVVSRGPSDRLGSKSIARVLMRPRPINDYPLHTLADDQRLTRRRQYAKAFQAIADWSSNYPDPTDNYLSGTPYGLSFPELRAEWARLGSAGWRGWELQERLGRGPLALAGVAA